MRRALAAAGSAAFFVLAPGVMAGLIPWSLTGWDARHTWPVLRVLGAALIAAGLVVLVQAFVRFVVEGVGTPAPVAPTEHLVVGGLYRHVRNPMYVAVDGDHRRAGARPRSARAAALRRRLRRRHRRLRALVRGAHAEAAVRRRVRGLPPRGARLVAAAASLAARRLRRHPERPYPRCDGPTCSPSQRTSGTADSSSSRIVRPALGRCSHGPSAWRRVTVRLLQRSRRSRG